MIILPINPIGGGSPNSFKAMLIVADLMILVSFALDFYLNGVFVRDEYGYLSAWTQLNICFGSLVNGAALFVYISLKIESLLDKRK